MAVYAAQVYAVDYNIGKLVGYLKSIGEYENTLIIFLADNGACAETYDELGSKSFALINDPNYGGAVSYGIGWANASNTPFYEYKVKPYEGGLATPLIVHYPAYPMASKGGLTKSFGHITDIMPTLVELSGSTYPSRFHDNEEIQPMVGRSLAEVMRVGERADPEYWFWEHQSYGAVRKGNWKAVLDLRDESWELFNLKTDRTEQHNLATDQPQLLEELQLKWQEWADSHHVFPKRKS